MSVTVTIAPCMQGHRLRIRDEKRKFSYFWQPYGWRPNIGDLLIVGLLFKILMATLDEFSVYLVVSKLLILATFGLQI